MPKENVNSSTSTDRRVEVCWHADPANDGSGHVQVASVHHPGQSPANLAYTTMPATVTTSSAAYPDTESGWYVDLDREQINRLIRVLRRARDAAYGADA